MHLDKGGRTTNNNARFIAQPAADRTRLFQSTPPCPMLQYCGSEAQIKDKYSSMVPQLIEVFTKPLYPIN